VHVSWEIAERPLEADDRKRGWDYNSFIIMTMTVLQPSYQWQERLSRLSGIDPFHYAVIISLCIPSRATPKEKQRQTEKREEGLC